MTSYTELEALLLGRLEEFGISRVADTTGLDRTRIDTASAVKPGTSDAIWVYSGKGLSPAHARTVAVMETLERTCALWPAAHSTLLATADQLDGPVWTTDRFTEGSQHVPTHIPLPWVRGSTLSGDQVWMPADLVYAGHRPPGLDAPEQFLVRTSNGLGAGFTLESALLHALLEVAERDIVSHFEVIASHAGVSFLAAVAESVGIDASWLAEAYQDDTSQAITVSLETAPAAVRALAEKFAGAGLALVAKALPNDFGLPTFGVACMEQITMSQVLGCAGYGTRMDPEAALIAALLELAQTRATDLQGAREDRHDPEKQRLPGHLKGHWLVSAGQPVTFDEAAAMFTSREGPALAAVAGAFDETGLSDIGYVSFEAPTGVCAIRVLVPGAETWHSTAGVSSLGPRLSSRINRHE